MTFSAHSINIPGNEEYRRGNGVWIVYELSSAQTFAPHVRAVHSVQGDMAGDSMDTEDAYYNAPTCSCCGVRGYRQCCRLRCTNDEYDWGKTPSTGMHHSIPVSSIYSHLSKTPDSRVVHPLNSNEKRSAEISIDALTDCSVAFQVSGPKPPLLSGGECFGFIGSYPYSPSGRFQ